MTTRRSSPTVGWVSVQWDSGQEAFYRVGADDAYDLSIVEQVTTTGVPTRTTPAPTAPPPSPSPSPSPSPLAASTCGSPSPDVCFFAVGTCHSPDVINADCLEISIARSVTNTKTWGVCEGGSIAASVEVNGGIASTGASTALSREVCNDQTSGAGVEVSHTIKVPGVKGQTWVACARGIHAVVKGNDFVSYRSGGFAICLSACPTPTCKFAPDDLGSGARSSVVNAAQSLQSIPLASLSLALSLVGGALLA